MSYSLSFSKSILVVVFISDKIQQGSYEFLSTKSIAEILSIPKPTLVKIMNSLTRAGIIETKEGKKGGIRLCKKPANITILDVFEAVEQGKPLFQTSIDILAEGKRPDTAKKVVTEVLEKAEQQMKTSLYSKTIQQILDEMSS